VVQRTLRRQAQDFLERPFVAGRAQIFEYSMTAREKSLYDGVTAYLLEAQILAFRGNQRRLLLIGFHRLMASSVKALAASLLKGADRLHRMLLARVRNFIARAETVLRDSKAEKLLDVMRVIGVRLPDRRRVVTFTESLVTQGYLRDLLIERGGLGPEVITLFRSTNDSPRAASALAHGQEEVGDQLSPDQRPSRSVAVRLALVHEFRTRSRVFNST